MTKRIYENRMDSRTLGEFIGKHYADYRIVGGSAPMNMDVTHGIEVETFDKTVVAYPFVKWTDGSYNSVHYWGSEYYIRLAK